LLRRGGIFPVTRPHSDKTIQHASFLRDKPVLISTGIGNAARN
jgi:hypothetical protein